MKLLILPLVLALGVTTASAQTKTTKTIQVEVAPGKSVTKKIYDMKDEGVVWPRYEGGEKGLMTFLSQNIKYPKEAELAGKEGRVLCSFVVNENGEVTDYEIKKSSDYQPFDDEALRVVKLMSKWTPGTKDGWPINVRYTLPVSFRLKKNPKADSIAARTNAAFKVAKEENRLGRIKLDNGTEEARNLPVFPGGAEGLMNYLKENVKYPETAKATKTEGRVICSYVVMEDGSVSDVKVVKSISPDLDQEAVRVIKSMPKYTFAPGTKDGKNVQVKFTLPITFKL